MTPEQWARSPGLTNGVPPRTGHGALADLDRTRASSMDAPKAENLICPFGDPREGVGTNGEGPD